MRMDASLSNADWTKQSWDLIGIDSLEKLLDYLRQNDIEPSAFMQLPVYQHNVEKLPWLKELEKYRA